MNECVSVVPENMPGVVDVRFVEREPAEKRSLLSWEQVKNYKTTPLKTPTCGLVVTLLSHEPALCLCVEKHVYSARGPARFLSDN